MKKHYLFLAISASLTAGAFAQEKSKFSLDGQFIPRTEWRDGFNTDAKNTGSADSANGNKGVRGYAETDVRAAIAATYSTDTYTTYLKVQDVFVTGDRAQLATANNGNFRMQEAWAELKLSDVSSLKIGRQSIGYDDERIIGKADWAMQARTQDAILYKYSKNNYNLDLGYSLSTKGGNVYTTNDKFSYRDMAFVHANKKYENLYISGLILNNTFQAGSSATADPSNKSNLTTAGFRFETKIAGIALNGNAYFQNGSRNGTLASTDLTVKGAYLTSLDAKINATEKTNFVLGTEIISGKNSNSAAFFPLFGTNHKFNGYMDKFYVGNYANAGGLVDANATVNTKVKDVALTGTLHYFTEQTDTNADNSKNLGTEVDLSFAKQFKGYTVKGGYSQFFDNGLSAVAKDNQNWAWLMLIINPKFI